jgi:hypothetical protein
LDFVPVEDENEDGDEDIGAWSRLGFRTGTVRVGLDNTTPTPADNHLVHEWLEIKTRSVET